MILVDSSIWVDHLRHGDAGLKRLLGAGQVVTHAFVIGELALGQLHQRKIVLQSLHDLPQAATARDEEVLDFIGRYALSGSGIGYVDAHLLASARLSAALLWTRDKRLHETAVKLDLAYKDTGIANLKGILPKPKRTASLADIENAIRKRGDKL